MGTRDFDIGEICTYKGFICRVDAVAPQITGETCPSRAYMGIPDGTAFNPTLTMMPLWNLDGVPVKNPKPKQDASGAVSRLSWEISELEANIEKLQQRLNFLKSL